MEPVYHEAFYNEKPTTIKEAINMKGILEFNLPADSVDYYNATKGAEYRQILCNTADLLEKSIRDAKACGSIEAEVLTQVLKYLQCEATELDVKLWRK